MSESCAFCGATEDLQTHHWLYGDEALEKKWTITVCVECHQKIHRRHGVGCGVGYNLKKNPETVLKLFKEILKNPSISNEELAKVVGLSSHTVSKLRMKWGLHKWLIGGMERKEVEKIVIWKLYTILELRKQKKRKKRRQGRKWNDIHVKDKLFARYAIRTGDTEGFKDFVNSVVEEAMKQEEEKEELARQKKEKGGERKK